MGVVLGSEQMRGEAGDPPARLGTRYPPEIPQASKGLKDMSWNQKTDSSLGKFFNSIDCLFPLLSNRDDSKSPGFIGCCEA